MFPAHAHVRGGLTERLTQAAGDATVSNTAYPKPGEKSFGGSHTGHECSGLKCDMSPCQPQDTGLDSSHSLAPSSRGSRSTVPPFTRDTWETVPGPRGSMCGVAASSDAIHVVTARTAPLELCRPGSLSPVPHGECYDTQASGHVFPPAEGSSSSYRPVPLFCTSASL